MAHVIERQEEGQGPVLKQINGPMDIWRLDKQLEDPKSQIHGLSPVIIVIITLGFIILYDIVFFVWQITDRIQ